VLVRKDVPPIGDVREPAQRGQLGNVEALNQYLHYQHQSFIIPEIITSLFVLFVTYYHYHYNKLDYSGVVILVFKYAGWITQELLL